MNYMQMIDTRSKTTGISGFFSAYGDFGIVDGADYDIEKIETIPNGYSLNHNAFTATCEYKEYENGVIMRKDIFLAKKDLVLNRYKTRFVLEGGEYEVYTQYSSWMNESKGAWQPLVTSIEVANVGIRSTEGATPMMAIKNKANGKIFVFHLLPNAAWSMKVSRLPISGKCDAIVLETGINDKGLSLCCKKDETLEMPSILFYQTENTKDFDAWKLHTIFNRLYPRRQLPVVYNTWLLNFDQIDIELIKKQVDTASDFGVEMFLVDAGWFGTTDNWETAIGDWEENIQFGFKGRLLELADYIRSRGMKFGLWIEAERALVGTKIYKTHPEYFITGSKGSAFLDFANKDAYTYILNTVLGLIDKYGIEWIKFDFNASLAYDPSGNGFYKYFKGMQSFIKEIREKHPNIYLTNCASGGTRMDLTNCMLFDSVWSSDNQSPIDGFRIFVDTSLRMPPCNIEKWDVRKFSEGFIKYAHKERVTLPISCHGGTWESVINVQSNYTHTFLTGGPIGFSADIASYPEDEKKLLTMHIAEYKKNREFYKNANLRILHRGETVTAIQYSDTELNRVVIQIFCKILNQKFVTVYPVLNKDMLYCINGKEIAGYEIAEKGLQIDLQDLQGLTIDIVSKN